MHVFLVYIYIFSGVGTRGQKVKSRFQTFNTFQLFFCAVGHEADFDSQIDIMIL